MSSTSRTVRLASPVSTRPGPTSRKRSARRRSEGRASPRASAPGWSAPRAAGPRTSSKGSAVTAEITPCREAGTVSQRGPAPHAKAREQPTAIIGEWNAPVTGRIIARSPSASAAADGLGRATHASTGKHHLLGGVVVGDGETMLRGEVRCALCGIATEHGDHAAGAGALPRLLHQPAAQCDQLKAIALG